MNKSIPSQILFVKYARHLINIWQALAVNVQMLGSLIKTMNLSSKDNSLKLSTNSDTWVIYYNVNGSTVLLHQGQESN